MSTNVTLTGRLGGDPELRFTKDGKAVASFSMVTSKPRKDPQTQQWVETETTWWRVTAWDRMAENVAESLMKGDPVVVVGRAHMETYKDKEGNDRQSLKVEAYNVAGDLKWNVWRKQGAERSNPAASANDPWNVPAQEEPPF